MKIPFDLIKSTCYLLNIHENPIESRQIPARAKQMDLDVSSKTDAAYSWSAGRGGDVLGIGSMGK